MATHQVRSGLQLLAGSLAGIFVCAVLFIFWVSAAVAGAFHAAADKARPEVRPIPRTTATPTVRVTYPVAAPLAPRMANVTSTPACNANVWPLALDEVTSLLDDGRGDDEIIAATAGRPLRGQIGSPEITTLRAYGASDRLVEDLRTRPIAGSLPRSTGYVAPTASMVFDAPTLASPARTAATASARLASQPAVAVPPTPIPIDYGARDRQVQALQKAIDSLDEQIRRYQTSSHNTFNQQTGDDYLKYIDKQRNDLRRQKWALEGC